MIGVRQAAVALLQGTEDCSIPHNTLELDCSGSMDWVVDMMAEVTHHITQDITLYNLSSIVECVPQSCRET